MRKVVLMKIRELVSKCRTNIHTWSVCLAGIVPLTPHAAIVEADGVGVPTLCSMLPAERLLVRVDPAPFGLLELSSVHVDAPLVRDGPLCITGSVSGMSGGGWTECMLQPAASYKLTPRWTVGGSMVLKVAGAQGFSPVVQAEALLSCLASVDAEWALAAMVSTVETSVMVSVARRIDSNWAIETGLHVTSLSVPAIALHGRYTDSSIALAVGLESAPMHVRIATTIPTSESFTIGCTLGYTAQLGISTQLSLCFVAW